MSQTKSATMDGLLEQADLVQLRHGDVIEGQVISVQKHEVCLDIGHCGIGIIYRRELTPSAQVEVGQTLKVSVINPETVGGYAVLSLRRALRNKGWDEIQRLYDASEMIEIAAYDANRGGLLIEHEGIRGFLPVSQLAADHYPRATGVDRDEILHKLTKLVGQNLKVCVLDLDRSNNKVIFSEKEALKEVIAQQLEAWSVGDVLEGVVTTVADFGVFVNISGIEGLVHISEISWERVSNPNNYVKQNQKVKVKVVAIDKDRLSLSLRQLTDDPWLKEIKQFSLGDKVSGKITRVTVFGAFVQITPVIEALVNISNVGPEVTEEAKSPEPDSDSGKKPNNKRGRSEPTIRADSIFAVGDSHEFTIIDINPESRKVALKLDEVPPIIKTSFRGKRRPNSSQKEAAAESNKSDSGG